MKSIILKILILIVISQFSFTAKALEKEEMTVKVETSLNSEVRITSYPTQDSSSYNLLIIWGDFDIPSPSNSYYKLTVTNTDDDVILLKAFDSNVTQYLLNANDKANFILNEKYHIKVELISNAEVLGSSENDYKFVDGIFKPNEQYDFLSTIEGKLILIAFIVSIFTIFVIILIHHYKVKREDEESEFITVD